MTAPEVVYIPKVCTAVLLEDAEGYGCIKYIRADLYKELLAALKDFRDDFVESSTIRAQIEYIIARANVK